MTSIPFPPKNSLITFREPFPGREWNGFKMRYYIKASVDGEPESEMRVAARQQMELMDYILQVDLKLTNAVVRCDALGRFTALVHSPQEDFFDLVKEVEND